MGFKNFSAFFKFFSKNFQFPLWDSRVSSRPLDYVVYLSIPFMGFKEQKETEVETIISFQFPLWDSSPYHRATILYYCNFQFPLWDSAPCSLLNPRDAGFQFPFWDSKEIIEEIIGKFTFQFPLWDS